MNETQLVYERMKNFEEENAKLKLLNEALINENNEIIKELGCKTCQIHTEFVELNNRITELENENVELREQCLALADCDTCFSPCKTENIEMKKQLTEAKYIILTLLGNFAYPIGREDWTVEDIEIVDKAEQFLKDEEK